MTKNDDRKDVVVVLVTAPAGEPATELAKGIVASKKAACVNIIPGIRSLYHWKGEVCDDPEALLVIKTTAATVEALKREVLSLHPYEVPEFLVVPTEGGHAAYLHWVAESVGAAE